MIKFFTENKINIIYNTPYLSIFNSIELCFRGLKNIIYKTIYKLMNSLKEDIHNIFVFNSFKKKTKYNFKETIFKNKKF
jgi:hypothetical protein